MPVGRIEFLYLYPMSFEEFLFAINPKLLEYIQSWSLKDEIGESIHQKLMDYVRIFFFIGGMPEAVSSYIGNQNLIDVQRIQNSILTTMQNDFSKYGTRNQQAILQKVMHYIPRNIGKKVKYVHIDRNIRASVLKEAFDLLSMSKVVHLIQKSDGNGIPLDAEVSPRSFKPLFLDIGLVNNICGLKLIDTETLITVYEGGLAEQFIGQELLHMSYDFQGTQLYYWSREEKNSNAELDYLIPCQNRVIPVEVKAGKTGTLKSLHLFLYDKKRDIGVRFNAGKPSLGKFNTKVRLKSKQAELNYTLLSLPLYLVGQVNRLLSG